VSVVYGTMANVQAWRFEIFESARYFQIESNQDVRFEFKSNLEASQVPTLKVDRRPICSNFKRLYR